ncbi:hypothetical protein WOLCODRAFT_166230 [Wolfiporia cocos MD-104 SS10]|uniref:Uncharacterized protein n=1 Tax=Wolfiporia cocos (strain MD-104) TaxID=742152 RepID=A0A2H3JF81_WOLCO|nr:hypothetical protein WOLCODRAFT_166230 [Wolfiporia cocos MD-104 SS10]
MRTTFVAALALVAAAAPALSLPLDELALLSRALQYRRSMDEIDSLFARSSNTASTVPWNRKLRGSVGIEVNPPKVPVSSLRRSPAPFVIPAGESIPYIPGCHIKDAVCRRALLNALD